MKKKIIPIIFIVMLFIITLMLCKTYAIEWQEGFKVVLSSEIEKNNGKKQVIIPVSIEDIDIEGGIVAYMAKIVYDENVFESIEVKGTDKWDNPYTVGNKVMGYKKTGEIAEKTEQPFNIILTVKNGAKGSKTKVTIKELSVGSIINAKELNKDYTIEVRLNNIDVIVKTIIYILIIAIVVGALVYYIYIVRPKKKEKMANEELAGLKNNEKNYIKYLHKIDSTLKNWYNKHKSK